MKKKDKKLNKMLYTDGGEKVGFDGKTWRWIVALNEFLQESPADLGLTDEQIRLNVNSRLPLSERMGLSTWEALKGSSDSKKGIDNLNKLSEEQRDFMKEVIAMSRAVKTSQMLRISTKETNKNSIGAHRIVQAINPHLQQNHLALGEGQTNIQITVGHESHRDLITNILNGKTIDVEHEDLTDQKELGE